jgi:hypothetical protein
VILTESFVYLHIPKTGGTFVEAALGQVLKPRCRTYTDTSETEHRGRYGVPDQHERLCDVPAEFRDRPLLVSVRNPYDHHVSLYEFGWWRHHPRDTFDPDKVRTAYPRFPDLTFREYVHAVNDWGLNEPSYAPRGGYGQLAALNVGPLTFDFIRFLARDPEQVLSELGEPLVGEGGLAWLPEATFLPMHRLNASLHAFLLEQGLSHDAADPVLTMARVLPDGSTRSAGMTWPGYYDDATRALVRHRERLLFSLFPEFEIE